MKSIEKTDKSSPRTDFLSTNFTMTTQTINFSKISKDKISEYIELCKKRKFHRSRVGKTASNTIKKNPR